MVASKIEARWRWARKFVDHLKSGNPADLLSALYDYMVPIAAGHGSGSFPFGDIGQLDEPPYGWGDPWLLGAVHEQAVSASERSRRGAWYTPEVLVRGLVRFAAAESDIDGDCLVVDPTCGGGAFLLAAADYLVECETDPAAVLSQLAGQDVDPLAVAVSRFSLSLWAMSHGLEQIAPQDVNLQRADALRHWPVDEGSRQLVIGNPPFASPLKSGAVPAVAEMFRSQNEALLGQYADLAAMHLLRASQAVGPGSTVMMVQPQSVLASRDCESLREHFAENMPLSGLWVAREAVFDAGVRACAPRLQHSGSNESSVSLASGREAESRGNVATATWPRLAADALGAPSLPKLRGQLAELGCSATAGFRDEYYGLAAACAEDSEDDSTLKLITVGLIDPLTNHWGRTAARFAGKRWQRPSVALGDLELKVAAWTQRQLRPKLLVATQARTLEPIIDRIGNLVPVTPVIAVHVASKDLDKVAAVLLAPPVVAWAWRTWFGSALSVDAVKLSAKQLLQLPLPKDQALWSQAAALVGEAEACEPTALPELTAQIASLMTEAYGADSAVFDWWLERRPA